MRKRKNKPGARRPTSARQKSARTHAAPGFAAIVRGCNALFAVPPPGAEVTRVTWRYLPHLLIAAFAVRAAAALSGDFLLHPDEVMQYLEPAHYAVFGSGILYWEYLHGARAWLVPGVVAAILAALDLLGLARPAVYVSAVKLAFCLISLLIPWAMYRFTQRAAGENAARLALIFGCFWYELAVMAHKPFTEFVGSALLLAGLVCMSGVDSSRARNLFAAGALLALAAAVRFQYAPVVAMLLALRSIPLWRERGRVVALAGGAAAVVTLVGILEWRTWGAPFHSYVTNYLVNVELSGARTGESSRWQLPGQLLAAGAGLPAVAFFLGARIRGAARILLLLSAVIFLLHLFPEHREYRFIFLLTPCWLMLLAMLLARAQLREAVVRGGVVTLLAFGALAVTNIFPWQSWIHIGHSKEKPVQYFRAQDPMFAALRYLAAADDVRGVFYQAENAPYFHTGGYYYLHHDVPFYDARTWGEAFRRRPNPAELVSHIVTASDAPAEQLPGFVKAREFGALAVWVRAENDAAVLGWRAPVVRQTQDFMNNLVARSVRGLRRAGLGVFVAERYWAKLPPAVDFAGEGG